MGRLPEGAVALSRAGLPNGLKVALFCGNYNYVKEGANQALNRLVRHLETRAGATVRVYSPVTDTPAFEPEGTLVPVASVPLPVRSEFRVALGMPAAIQRDVAAFAPDLVHLSTPDLLDRAALSWARRQAIPTVASLHTAFETYLEHYRLGFLRPTLERWLDRFYGDADFVLVPTASIAADLDAKIGRERVRIWGRGVDADLYSPARRSLEWRRSHGIADGQITLLFFGRLVIEKGIDRYIETVKALGRRVTPVIVGAGPARERLERALPTAVFTGHVTGEALATAVASSDILIHPSVTETFGNVVLEAMACGVPVVAAEHPAMRNLIEHDRSGLLVDPAGFVPAALSLIENPEFRHAIGASAREAALRWRWDEILDDVLAVYGEALMTRRSFDAHPSRD